MTDPGSAPLSTPSVAALAASGLRMALVDTADERTFDAWYIAANRGFHGAELDDELRARRRRGIAFRRTVGVYDDSAHRPEISVGTANSWRSELTIPGERTIDAWAISSVSVAQTHRRRGIARALVDDQLATAASLRIPVAMLTVSESSIYGRFGFAPAAMAADWSFATRRVRWTGPVPSGRVDMIAVDEWRERIPEIHERARLLSTGDIAVWPGRWDELAGLLSRDPDAKSRLRAAQYRDEAGVVRGLVLYRISGGEPDFTEHTLTVEALDVDSADAYAALWRFVLETDLVSTVQAELRSIDEPVRWMISDWRGATVSTYEHQYLRILDVVGAFSTRSYITAGSLALVVDDPLGYAVGTWLLTVTGADAVVERVDEVPAGAPALALGVAELSALYLGGVAVPTLVAAGRVRELTPGAAVEAEALLHSPVAPWLARWY